MLSPTVWGLRPRIVFFTVGLDVFFVLILSRAFPFGRAVAYASNEHAAPNEAARQLSVSPMLQSTH